jgi:hypothetical protein
MRGSTRETPLRSSGFLNREWEVRILPGALLFRWEWQVFWGLPFSGHVSTTASSTVTKDETIRCIALGTLGDAWCRERRSRVQITGFPVSGLYRWIGDGAGSSSCGEI